MNLKNTKLLQCQFSVPSCSKSNIHYKFEKLVYKIIIINNVRQVFSETSRKIVKKKKIQYVVIYLINLTPTSEFTPSAFPVGSTETLRLQNLINQGRSC